MNDPYSAQARTAMEAAPANQVEGYALIEMARRLTVAQENPDDREALLYAVRTNWRLWTILQAELVDPDCPVPVEIRENLLNLSNFVDKRSAELIGKPDPAALSALINVNRQIGAGLLGNAGEGAQDQPAAAPSPDPSAAPIAAPPTMPTDTEV